MTGIQVLMTRMEILDFQTSSMETPEPQYLSAAICSGYGKLLFKSILLPLPQGLCTG